MAKETYISGSASLLNGYCSTVQGLLDWFEVDLGFAELLFIQISLCVVCVLQVELSHFVGGPCDVDEIVSCLVLGGPGRGWTVVLPRHCNTLQYTATHYNTLQHTATHCNTLQHAVTHCNTL